MKMIVLIGLCVLLLGGLAWTIVGGESQVTNAPPKNDTIVAFGDSLIAGVGATKGNDLVSVLSRKLGVPIINLGKSGDTTADGVARMEAVFARDPGIVILLLGGNDYLRRINTEETRANLATLITAFQERGAMVVLLGVRGGVLRDEYAPLFAALSETYHTLYVPDVLDGVFAHPNLMSDAIHPNDAGYAVIAERVHDALDAYIGKTK